jgi:hypothetical protein
MSIDINNYLRSGGSIDRQTLNKILESLQAANPDVEDDALQEKIAFAPEMHNKTTTDESGGADALASETRDRDDFAFTLTPGSKTSYPVTNTKTGTITFQLTDLKFGAEGKFDGSSYITIPHNTAISASDGNFGMIFWFKSTQQGGAIYSKSNLTDEDPDYDSDDYLAADYLQVQPSESGIEVIVNPAQNDNFLTADFDTDDFSTTSVNNSVYVEVEDGSDTVTLNALTATNIFDGNWHSICVNSTVLSDPDYLAANYLADDYETVVSGSEVLQIYLDKVSIGSTSSSVIDNLTTTENALIGADKTGSRNLQGSLAHWFLESKPLSTTEIADFHDKARMTTKNQLNAIQFITNEASSVNDEVY